MNSQTNQLGLVFGVLVFLTRMAQASSVSWVGAEDVRVDIYKNHHYEGGLYLWAGERETVVLPSGGEIEWVVVNAYTRYPICHMILNHDQNQEITLTPHGCIARQ